MNDRRNFIALGLGSAALSAAGGCGGRARVAAGGHANAGRTPAQTPAKVVRADEGLRVWAMGILVTVKVTSADTGGAYAIFEDLVPPGAGPVPHTHSREDETLYVLEGGLTAWLGGVRHELAVGDFVHMPRGVEHFFRNESDRPTRMLLTYTPGGFEGWFADVGVPVAAGAAAGNGPAVGAADIAKAVSAARGYGVEFVGQ